MPEYLAPGVYVEETSFRAKSIEGVSTSTTGFVGLTRKGPVDGPPELITSFGDFERIYGGFAGLELGPEDSKEPVPNYLAHAVRAYFDNGGSRLYVARVNTAPPSQGRAKSEWVGDGTDKASKIRFVARFPGQVGNGQVTVRLMTTPATGRGMAAAAEGSVLRVLTQVARLEGNKPQPFTLKSGQNLELKGVGTIQFLGQPAAVTGSKVLADPVDLDDEEKLEIDLGEGLKTIALPNEPTGLGALAAAINDQLQPVGGEAAIVAGKLVLRTLRKGSSAEIKVKENTAFGFSAAAGNLTAKNTRDEANNVVDLARVSAEEVGALLGALPGAKVSVSVTQDGNLVLSSKETRMDQTLQAVDTGSSSAHVTLGFDTGVHTGVTRDYLKTGFAWKGSGDATLDVANLAATAQPDKAAAFLTANVLTVDADGDPKFYEDLGLGEGHPRYIGSVLGITPGRRSDALENLFAIELGANVTALRLLTILSAGSSGETLFKLGVFANPEDPDRAIGNDGVQPGASSYEGPLDALGRIEDISIVAAPGHSAYDNFQAIQGELIQHVERRRAYRVAVLDTPPAQSTGQAIEVRSRIDSTRAALYYPWVVTDNPLARPGFETIDREITLPPSGFVCGIYARNDVERSVAKAPANEVVRGALRFETDVNFAEQEVLNPAGVNCLRFFPGRGYRVWGARTASSDPEWKYVNVRRYFLFLEHSIDRGTQWSVFENNGERLWANVRETLESFLYNEWRSGNLLGGSPAEAYFVRCDRSTMTQNDLDNGRLICLIGVAVLKPAEFVVFRIGQKTADART